MSERENWLSSGVAADRLGISRGALVSKAEAGLIRCAIDPESKYRYFHVDDIEAYKARKGMIREPWGNEQAPIPDEVLPDDPERALF